MKKTKFKINVSDLVIIVVFALIWEGLSIEFWDYDPEKTGVMLFGQFPVMMFFFWIGVFWVSLVMSEYIFKRTDKAESIPLFRTKLYVIDIFTFGIIGTFFEYFLHTTGCFEYSSKLGWTFIPYINLPVNAVLGYFGIGTYAPTMIRFWRGCKEAD